MPMRPPVRVSLPSPIPATVFRRRTRAFTVTELLVVIAVIAVLIAMLFPSLQRARRKALVLASPIVYVGVDNRLHLTDPSGAADLPLAVPTRMECPVCHSPPAWSPSGQSIAFRLVDEAGPSTAILEPFSGLVTRFPEEGRSFVGWLDPASLASTASSAPEPFVGTVRRAGRSVVTFFRKDLSVGRRVWGEPGGVSANEYPQVDPMGEFVAWSRQRPGGGDARAIALKPVAAPPDQPPAMIGLDEFKSVHFCDWTEQGTLLANATTNNREWMLVVFDRDGRLLRRMATAVSPSKGSIASWRKYGHR